MKGYVSATGFYQSFLLYLTRHEGSVQSKAILGNPTAAGAYATDTTLNGVDDTENLGAYANADVHVNQSFAEFVTGNLGSAFSSAYTIEVHAEVRLTYTAPGAVPRKKRRGSERRDSVRRLEHRFLTDDDDVQ